MQTVDPSTKTPNEPETLPNIHSETGMTEPTDKVNKRELDYDSMSFGRYLKALRLEKGLSIEAVAKETRVNLKALELIELEDHDHLPDEVFVKGFIRSYAQLVDVNPDELVQRYLANLHLHRQNARFKADMHRSGRHFWSRMLLSLVALTGFTILSVLLLLPPEIPNRSENPVDVETEETIPTETPSAKPAVNQNVPPPPPSIKTHSLSMAAVKQTWVKIIIDDQLPKTYNLNPGDRLELTAKKGFNLLIGNGAALTLKLNDKSIPVPSNQGNMVTIRLP